MVHALFTRRFSATSFTGAVIPKKDLNAMVLAAMTSPSCYNEQPWRFLIADTPVTKASILKCLVEPNRKWAQHAGALVGLFAKKHFDYDGKLNAWAEFDLGAAWMAFNLQACALGYQCHAMGGFNSDILIDTFSIDRKLYIPKAIIAIGATADESPWPKKRLPIESVIISAT